MARNTDAKCRKCRRAMDKLFLKGDRCNTPKCGLVRRASIPGMHGKKMKRNLSEFGMQLAVKQKIKRIYGILEKQIRKHFEEIKGKKGVSGDLLLERLEMRLDNVVYRIGFGNSRSQARQLVNHGWIRVNGKKVDIPSFKVKMGDTISFSENKLNKNYLKNIEQVLKNKKDFPGWISFDSKEYAGKVTGVPKRDEMGINIDAQVVVEYYSR
jgi:small subunit ribosomal protein S4